MPHHYTPDPEFTHSVHKDFFCTVKNAFSSQGELARANTQFFPRPGQTAMALAVAQTIVHGGKLVVEAQTGTGKTFAYLAPVLLSGEKALISTATKNLQDQLFRRDLPFLIQTLQLPVRIALLKGRSSYLCPHRLGLARRETTIQHQRPLLERLHVFAQNSTSGDLSEFAALSERSGVLPWVTSTRENCLGAECPQYQDCFVQKARKEALDADLVIVNHHLFFADLMLRESGMAALLPHMRAYVFDEAHQINETGIQFLGMHWSTAQAVDLARDLLAAGLQYAQGFANWSALAASLERSARDLRLILGQTTARQRVRWSAFAPQNVAQNTWRAGIESILHALKQIHLALQALGALGPDFARLYERGQQQQALLECFAQPRDPHNVRWLDINTHLRLAESPLEIGAALHAHLLELEQRASTPEIPAKAWIFTSATLGTDPKLQWFTKPCALQDARTLQVQSPFDYANQAALYIPAVFVTPKQAQHSAAVAALAGRAATHLGGHTLVLTTTLRALQAIADALALYAQSAPLQILQQGSMGKHALLQRFLRMQGKHCILLASMSFWEGVDIAGDALQLVLIDKLPFPPPGDPLVEARAAKTQSDGGDPFMDYFVPEATVLLKQGAGRLIRSVTDKGILAVCDVRLLRTAYGKQLLHSLPDMQTIHSEQAFFSALDALRQNRDTNANANAAQKNRAS